MVENNNNKLSSKPEPSLANAPKSKKISFFAAMSIVVGSSIGAGIFLRSGAVLSGSWESLVLAIFTWLLAGFAIIAMALSLVEVASGNLNNNLSVIGWCKQFNNRTIYKASKNFMFYIYLPLTYFFMPLYAIIQLQDGIGAFQAQATGSDSWSSFTFGTEQDALIISVIALAISLYFMFASGWSSRVGNIQNMVISALKFIPLIVAGVIGFVFIGMNPDQPPSAGVIPPPPAEGPISLGAATPVFGVTLAITGIFFAYDGFYVTAGLQTEMKEPKKTPLALLFGLLFVTGVYLLIAVSMSLGAGGSFYGFGDWLVEQGAAWLFGIVNVLIAVGILGILNGFGMWGARFTEDLIKEGELPFSHKFKNKLNSTNPKIGILYSLAITLPIFIIFTLIGIYGYIDTGAYTDTYGAGMEKLLPFADLMANWTALFAFGFITFAIYGCLKNRKTNRVEVDKKKYFVPMAIASIIIIFFNLIISVLVPIFDLFLLVTVQNGVGANEIDIISRVMLIVALAIFFGLSFGPTLIEDALKKKNLPLANHSF